MLVFSEQSLVYFAVPKTGTTAVEMALKPRADIVFTKQRKHMTAQRFHTRVAPFLRDTFDLLPDRVAVIRDPVDQIRSWYRYRSGPRRAGTARSTNGCSFDDFVLAVISDTPPAFAGIGSQYNMLTSGHLKKTGDLLVHHLFAYDHQPLFRGFLSDRFGTDIVLKQKNVSPDAPAPLDPEIEAQLRKVRAREFELYDQVMQAGGHLVHTL